MWDVNRLSSCPHPSHATTVWNSAGFWTASAIYLLLLNVHLTRLFLVIEDRSVMFVTEHYFTRVVPFSRKGNHLELVHYAATFVVSAEATYNIRPLAA